VCTTAKCSQRPCEMSCTCALTTTRALLATGLPTVAARSTPCVVCIQVAMPFKWFIQRARCLVNDGANAAGGLPCICEVVRQERWCKRCYRAPCLLRSNNACGGNASLVSQSVAAVACPSVLGPTIGQNSPSAVAPSRIRYGSFYIQCHGRQPLDGEWSATACPRGPLTVRGSLTDAPLTDLSSACEWQAAGAWWA
jgi:hypothetical protein